MKTYSEFIEDLEAIASGDNDEETPETVALMVLSFLKSTPVNDGTCDHCRHPTPGVHSVGCAASMLPKVGEVIDPRRIR